MQRMAERQSSQTRGSMASPVRSSLRRLSNPNIFSDDFALEPLNVSGESSPTVQESPGHGQTPVTSSNNTSHTPSITPDPPHRASYNDTKSSDGYMPRRSFTQPSAANSSSNHAMRHPSIASSTSNTPSSPQRSMSTSSRFSLPRAQSPYRGPTGPSQPYAMYPQVTRNSSVTTASTVRPAERPFAGSAGPEHPYGMYPQNTVAEEEDHILPVPGLAVGFPGMGQNYQRRIGQDGEEAADIIGPDGHTEQLPPYSRYPDNAAAKSGGDSATALNIPDSAGSADPPMSPQSRMSSRTMFSDANVEVNTAAARTAGNDPSGCFKEKLRERGKRRVCCGVPLWVFALLFIVFLGIVVGAVIGGVVGARRGAENTQAAAVAAAAQSAA